MDAELTPDELAEAIRELRRTYGTGLAPLRLGASVNLEGRIVEARPLAEAPAGTPVVCLFCSHTREFPSLDALRAVHVDKHGMNRRAEQHVYCWRDKASGQIWTDGPPFSESP